MADRFYTTGGTLSQDAPSYVERQADRALIEGLERGEYCYILTSRQMGKSSLMIRTASRLRNGDHCHVAVLDLSAVGQNLSPEQWYDGMLLRLGRQLGLEDEFDDFWLDHPRLSPVQRFFEALYQVVLLKKPGRFVVFIDELDTVRSLPFASDEFFAAIRQCFNERSQDPIWERLSFCLLGVATPSDLIKDPHISPFNIGRRIVLEDFKKNEVAKLVGGLEADDRGEILLERIFGWTNGHPYLTQRLCRAVAEQNRDDAAASVLQAGTIDGICHRLFLSNRAKERDDNLIFVRERLLRSDHDRAAVLDLYRKVRSGVPVVDDEANPLIGALHLSGVTQIDKGKLRVRNRIYRHVFSATWIKATMPDAEKRRQQEAYRRGVIRTTGLAFLVLVAMTYLAVTAYVQSQRAKTRLIAQNTDNGSRLLDDGENYDALAWFTENLKLTKEGSVSEELGRKRFASVLRHSPKLVEILPHNDAVRYLTFSPDGLLLLTASDDQFARVWNLNAGELAFPPVSHGSSVIAASFSPDGSRFVTASADQFARVFSTETGEMIGVPMRHDYEVVQAVFSHDGQLVATASLDDTARIWSAETGLPLGESLQHRNGVNHVSFSADGKYLVSASLDRTARVWGVTEGASTAILELVHEESVTEAIFNPNGKLVATGSEDGWLRLWEIDSGEEIFSLQHPGSVSSIDFSPDGHQLATACRDGLVRLLNVAELQMVKAPLIHRDPLSSVRFSPAGD
ncbi:AAA-like domain-containing protein, partial [bacterium]|nr:AAA-like domain-containing protein [bacterium]